LVIGILDQKGQSAQGRDQDNIVMMPLSTARSRVLGKSLVKPSAVHGILVKVTNVDNLDRASMDIRRRLRIRHRLWADERDDFQVRDLTQVAKARRDSVQQFTLLVGIIASVSLLVGGIGIMNTLMVSVSERVREIGIRLSVGAEPRDIRRQFLTESLILSAIGGIVGVGAGAVAAMVISELTGWVTHVSPYAVLLAIGVSLLVGVGFGLYPAMKAASMEPARSLKAE
jgi:putative ABC transport system permease protein